MTTIPSPSSLPTNQPLYQYLVGVIPMAIVDLLTARGAKVGNDVSINTEDLVSHIKTRADFAILIETGGSSLDDTINTALDMLERVESGKSPRIGSIFVDYSDGRRAFKLW